MSIIFIGGVNGVGKTSILQKIPNGSSIIKLHGTAELMKWLKISIGDYHKLQNLQREITEKALEEIFYTLAINHKSETIVITAHYVKIFDGKIEPSYGHWYKYCDALVLIIGNSKEIVGRIINDEDNQQRARNIFGTIQKKEELIKKAQYLSAKTMLRAARTFDVPFYYIKNTNGKLGKAVEQLALIINS